MYDINKDNDLPKSGCPFACWLLYWNHHLKRHHWWKKLKEYGWTDYSTEKIATYLRKAYLGGDQTACGYVARMVLNGCGPFSQNEDLAMMILYTLGHPSANLWIAQYLHKKGEVYKCEHELTISLFCQPPSLHSHSFVDPTEPCFNPRTIMFYVENVGCAKLCLDKDVYKESKETRKNMRSMAVRCICMLIPVATMEDKMTTADNRYLVRSAQIYLARLFKLMKRLCSRAFRKDDVPYLAVEADKKGKQGWTNDKDLTLHALDHGCFHRMQTLIRTAYIASHADYALWTECCEKGIPFHGIEVTADIIDYGDHSCFWFARMSRELEYRSTEDMRTTELCNFNRLFLDSKDYPGSTIIRYGPTLKYIHRHVLATKVCSNPRCNAVYPNHYLCGHCGVAIFCSKCSSRYLNEVHKPICLDNGCLPIY